MARFLRKGMTVEEAVLRKCGFRYSPYQDVRISEAARWGEKFRHYYFARLEYFDLSKPHKEP